MQAEHGIHKYVETTSSYSNGQNCACCNESLLNGRIVRHRKLDEENSELFCAIHDICARAWLTLVSHCPICLQDIDRASYQEKLIQSELNSLEFLNSGDNDSQFEKISEKFSDDQQTQKLVKMWEDSLQELRTMKLDTINEGSEETTNVQIGIGELLLRGGFSEVLYRSLITFVPSIESSYHSRGILLVASGLLAGAQDMKVAMVATAFLVGVVAANII